MALPPPLQRRLAGRPVVVDGQTLDPETQLMLRLQRLARDPGLGAADPGGRAGDCAGRPRLAGGRQPIGEVRDLEVPGGDGPLRARLYIAAVRRRRRRPRSPLLVFFHGGGLVFGDLDTHDATCRFLAERAGVRVLAVDYRLAPEHPFPAAVDDCWAAFQWVAEHADELGVDPDRIAVGGDSAGGTLAAVVAIRGREAGVPLAFQLLVYPATDMAERQREPAAVRRRASSSPASSWSWRTTTYLAADARPRDPRVSVLFAEKIPAGLAPALRRHRRVRPAARRGRGLRAAAGRGRRAGRAHALPGPIHGFFNVVGVGRAEPRRGRRDRGQAQGARCTAEVQRGRTSRGCPPARA